MRLLVQQHLLLSIPGQIERIHLQLLFPLRLFTAVRVRVQTRLLARVVGHAAGQYEALIPLEGHHASPRLGYRLYAWLAERRSRACSWALLHAASRCRRALDCVAHAAKSPFACRARRFVQTNHQRQTSAADQRQYYSSKLPGEG